METTCFFYETTTDLVKAQLILIELGNHLVDNADLVEFEYRSYYYNLITLLFVRGEFALENFRHPKKSRIIFGNI